MAWKPENEEGGKGNGQKGIKEEKIGRGKEG